MSAALRESDALHARARAMIEAYEHDAPLPESFDALAADLARFQAAHIPGYARLCRARGVEPAAVRRASQVPAVPAEAFKIGSVFAFDAGAASSVFRTSGTSGGSEARGTHRMRTAVTYDAAALAFGRTMLGARDGAPRAVLVLGPSPREAPDSSLAHMFGLFARALGDRSPAAATFFVEGGVLRTEAFADRVRGLSPGRPALVLATSFALVHLLDAWSGEAPGPGSPELALPRGSKVVQTGGFKGRTREVAADELRRRVSTLFAVDERDVFAEYGMTELSSQFWEAIAIDPEVSHGVFAEPPWARVVPVDPDTLEPVPEGTVGLARIEDLANVDSAFAVLTHDRVRRSGHGFELLGRAGGAAPRGCSIAIDEMLSGRPSP